MDGISASPAAIGAARRGAERALAKVASKKNAPHRAPFLDLHAANKTAVYLELYPHMDAVWTGEASNYELGPDHFLVGVAGVPFGLPSQMLSGAVRKQPRLYYRALLFGMTERAGWFDSDTSLARLGALWAVVDAFELRDSELVGFWRRGDARFAATAPGDCGDRVKRTAFVVDGAAVVVLASWASTPCAVDVDVAALGPRAAAFQPRVPHLQCGAPAEDVASGTLRVDVDAGAGAVVVAHGPARAAAAAPLVPPPGPCPAPSGRPRPRGPGPGARRARSPETEAKTRLGKSVGMRRPGRGGAGGL